MMETSLLISTSLLFITLCIVIAYSRKMKEVSERYIEAKNILGDVILSFRRDLRQQENKIRLISQRIDDFVLWDEGSKIIEELRSEVMRIKTDLEDTSNLASSLSTSVEKLRNNVEDLSLQQKENMRKITELEESVQKEPLALDRIETAIPIKRDKALARLTETEMRVLEILNREGEKTASQIRDRIGLTREHTARLMKSLYTRGYVERTVEKLPYVYIIKDEMMRIMEKVKKQ